MHQTHFYESRASDSRSSPRPSGRGVGGEGNAHGTEAFIRRGGACRHERYLLAAIAAVALGTAAPGMAAETPADLQRSFEAAAKQSSAGFTGLSAQRGEQLFKSTHGNEWSCASCHGDNPLRSGRHAKTGKQIAPLAPAANVERFTSVQKVEKWFKRNCNDVLGRACSPLEKGDVLAYLMSLSK